jgi:hypothetical protein
MRKNSLDIAFIANRRTPEQYYTHDKSLSISHLRLKVLQLCGTDPNTGAEIVCEFTKIRQKLLKFSSISLQLLSVNTAVTALEHL